MQVALRPCTVLFSCFLALHSAASFAKEISFPADKDWLQNDQILRQAVLGVGKKIKVDRSYDIPYTAGYSKDGKTIFIHRGLPQSFVHQGKVIKTDAFLILHEAVEMSIEHQLGLRYQLAHQIALRAERAAVEAAGLPWAAYNEFMNKYLEEMAKKVERIPAALDLQPYEDENDADLLKRMKAAMVPAASS